MSDRPPGTQLLRKITSTGLSSIITPAARGAPIRRPISGGTTYRRSATSTASSFGGINGGMGATPRASAAGIAAASAIPITPAASAGGIKPTALGPSVLTNIGSSVSKAGVNISNTFGSVIPLAIKIIIAVVVIKVVLWLVKRRR